MKELIEQMIRNPFSPPSGYEEIFQEAVLQLAKHHYDTIPRYKKFLANNEVDWNKSFLDLPGLPVRAFKSEKFESQHEEVGFRLSSSGTTGAKSSVWVTADASRLQKVAAHNVLKSFLGDERRPVLVFDADPKTHSKQSARSAAILGYGRYADTVTYLMEYAGDELRLKRNWRKMLTSQENQSRPALVVGFTYILYETLKEFQNKSGVALPAGSLLIHIGGWKKLESQRVTSSSFKSALSSTLGLPMTNIRDIYGFTELMGANFVECEEGYKHVPSFVFVRALSMETLSPLSPGNFGVLQFFSPLALSHPGCSLITDDTGTVIGTDKPCECGRQGQRIIVSGRREKAETRGCGDILGESLTLEIVNQRIEADSISIFYPDPAQISTEDFSINLSHLSDNASQIRALDKSEILLVLDELREEWRKLANEENLAPLRNHGLDYLIDWTRPDNLRQLLIASLPGGISSNGEFANLRNTKKRVAARPVGNVAQWASGNVPFLGIYSLIISWLTGNTMAIRVSSRDQNTMVQLIRPLSQLADYSEAARILSKSVMIFGYSKSHSEANRLLRSWADTSIIWGGSEAVHSISSFPGKTNSRDIVFGPRTSFSVVFESAVDSERKLALVARRIAADTAAFNQLACSSPHTVFLVSEKSGLLGEISHRLSVELGRRLSDLGSTNTADLSVEIELDAKVKSIWAKQILSGENHKIIELDSWTKLPLPAFGHTLHTIQLEEAGQLSNFVNDMVQTVSIAGTAEERLSLALELAGTKVTRFTYPGQMTNFELPWDGEDIIQSLVKYVVLH